MNFADKYSTKEEEKKILISKDAFAIGEMIENLIKQIEALRLSAIR